MAFRPPPLSASFSAGAHRLARRSPLRGTARLVECIDRPIAFDPRDLRIGAAHARSTLKALRAAHYDAVIDLQGLVKSAVLARCAGAARTIGLSSRACASR
jgi:ADP-heptose:LPS heptosyltransferase